jgi:hypothetical protein
MSWQNLKINVLCGDFALDHNIAGTNGEVQHPSSISVKLISYQSQFLQLELKQ